MPSLLFLSKTEGNLFSKSVQFLFSFGLHNSSLKAAIPGITEKVLYERLKELEHDGLIERQDLQLDKPHVEYCLTAITYKLVPVLLDLWEWGDLIKKGDPRTAT